MNKTIKMVLLKTGIKGRAGNEIEVFTQRSADAMERKGIAAYPDTKKEEEPINETKKNETVVEKPAVSVPQKPKNQIKK